MHEKVYVEDGEWRANSGPQANWVAWTPAQRMTEQDRRFQSAAERSLIESEPISISLLPEGATEAIEVTSDTTLFWRATFEPFKRELREAYPWIEFIHVTLPPPDQRIAKEMAEADLRDGMLTDLIPDKHSRGVVIDSTNEALVLGARIGAAPSLDAMHQRVLTARQQRGQAVRVFGHRALQVVFPTVDRMAWEDVDAARGIAGLADLRAILSEIEQAAWSVAESGTGLEEGIRQAYMARFERAVAQLQPSLRGTAIAIAMGTGLGILTGPLAPIVGIAAGAAQTIASNYRARRSFRSSWMAASERLRKIRA